MKKPLSISKIVLAAVLSLSYQVHGAQKEPAKKDIRENLKIIENRPEPEKVADPDKPELAHDKIEKPRFFFSDTQAFAFYTGGAYYLLQTNSDFYGLFGLSYMLHSQTRFHVETAFDIYTRQEGHWRIMAKIYSRITDSIRPYASAGLGLKILSSDNIGVFLAWNRVMGFVNAGFDTSLSQSTSVKTEIYIGVDQSLNSLYGVSIGPVFSY